MEWFILFLVLLIILKGHKVTTDTSPYIKNIGEGICLNLGCTKYNHLVEVINRWRPAKDYWSSKKIEETPTCIHCGKSNIYMY